MGIQDSVEGLFFNNPVGDWGKKEKALYAHRLPFSDKIRPDYPESPILGVALSDPYGSNAVHFIIVLIQRDKGSGLEISGLDAYPDSQGKIVVGDNNIHKESDYSKYPIILLETGDKAVEGFEKAKVAALAVNMTRLDYNVASLNCNTAVQYIVSSVGYPMREEQVPVFFNVGINSLSIDENILRPISRFIEQYDPFIFANSLPKSSDLTRSRPDSSSKFPTHVDTMLATDAALGAADNFFGTLFGGKDSRS
jgi:hypothetical protein